MEAINTDDRETEEKFLKNMLTPEMQENGRDWHALRIVTP